MIRPITSNDYQEYLSMATEFYNSDAVLHPIPESYIEKTFYEFTTSNTYAQGYLFEYEGEPAGYALLAKTYSQEAGGIVIWIEELYVRPRYQNKGIGREFFDYLDKITYDSVARLRLEVEDDNKKAIALYERLGFNPLNYSQMVKERPDNRVRESD